MSEASDKAIVLSSLNREKILLTLGIHPDKKQERLQADAPVSGSHDPNTVLSSGMLQQISQCEERILSCICIRYVYRILPAGEAAPVLAGHDIHRLLYGCGEVVLMALTLGAEVERLLMREEVISLSDAYVMDVCASQAVEEAADILEERLSQELLKDGQYLTNRFSPGYGDYPLTMQRPLLAYLNASRAIGLTLTPANLMVPRKSVTAVMGISKEPKPEVYGDCSHCVLLTKCSRREHGARCWQS